MKFDHIKYAFIAILFFLAGQLACIYVGNFFGGIHADEQSVRIDTVTIEVPMPPAMAIDVPGHALDSTEKRILHDSRLRRMKSLPSASPLYVNNMVDSQGTKIGIDPCPDMSFGFRDSVRWSDTTNYVLPDGKQLRFTDSGFYHFAGVADCSDTVHRGLPYLTIWSTPRRALIFQTNTTNTVTERDIFTLSVFGMKNLVAGDYVVGLKGELSFGDLHGSIAPMVSPNTALQFERIDAALEYDVWRWKR